MDQGARIIGFTADDLVDCYRCGIFPMADSRDDDDFYLVEPRKRGVIPLDALHISNRLARTVRSDHYRVVVDQDFAGVISACAASRPERLETWINGPIERLYLDLFARGQAHSVEAYDDAGDLVGGLYGVSLGGAFFGESMFSRHSNASKLALAYLVHRLRAGGFQALIGVTHYDEGQEEQLLREQLLHRPAGLLITGRDHNAATRALIARSQVPCVHLMDLPDAGEAKPPYCVGFRQNEAGAALTRRLLATGRKRIAFAGAQLDPRVMQRLYGWRSALQEAGCYEPTLEWLNPASSSLALGGVMFEQIMGQSPAIDAIFFCNDDLAQGALLAALRLKVAVPGRVAVAGFNDLTGSDQMLPPLTTVRTPRARIGEAGATMLLSLMRGEAQTRSFVDLGFEIVERGST